MDLVTIPAEVLTTHILFTLSLLTLWIPIRLGKGNNTIPFWSVLFVCSLGLAVFYGLLLTISFLSILILGSACYAWSKVSNWGLKGISCIVIIVSSIALASHLAPGFLNPNIISEPDLKPIYLNLDKPLVGLFILGFTHQLLQSKARWGKTLLLLLPYTVGTIVVVAASALLMQFVRFDVKFNSLFLIWGWQNLFYTCIAEEAFFRGFLQKNLSSWLSGFSQGKVFGLLLSSILFGLAHYAGGINYILLSSLAGLGYGLVYLKTDSIEASVLTHFLLNSINFVFFTNIVPL